VAERALIHRAKPRDPIFDRPTPPEQRFVDEYLVDMDRDRAYCATFGLPGCAAKASQAFLKRGRVQLAVQRALASKRARLEIQGDDLLRFLLDVLRFDPRTICDDEGRLLPMSEWPDGAARALAAFDVEQERVVGGGRKRKPKRSKKGDAESDDDAPEDLVTARVTKVKTIDKLKAAELVKKIDLKTEVSFTAMIQAARAGLPAPAGAPALPTAASQIVPVLLPESGGGA
jgi:hypothetical protein